MLEKLSTYFVLVDIVQIIDKSATNCNWSIAFILPWKKNAPLCVDVTFSISSWHHSYIGGRWISIAVLSLWLRKSGNCLISKDTRCLMNISPKEKNIKTWILRRKRITYICVILCHTFSIGNGSWHHHLSTIFYYLFFSDTLKFGIILKLALAPFQQATISWESSHQWNRKLD